MLNQNSFKMWGGKKMSSDNGKKDEKDDKKKEVDGLRTVFLSGHIIEETTKDVVQALLRMQKEDPLSPIKMIVDSFGGSVDAMFAITDTMNSIVPEIETICLGKAMSAAAHVFISGTKGRRLMMPHSRLLFHQMTSFTYGSTADIIVDVEEIKFLQEELYQEMAEKSNLSIEEVRKLIDRSAYVRPEQAIEMGFADEVVTRIS